MSKENLERVLDLANDADYKLASLAWFRYQAICAGIASHRGFKTETAVAVFAALSPNSDYYGNLRDVDRLLHAASLGKGLTDFNVSTYGANKVKAWRIVKGEDPLDLIRALKTRNFFLNIRDPLDPHPVTVDGHIFNVWQNRRIALNSPEMKTSQKKYEEVASLIRQIGAERNLIPNVVQGLIWYCWKRLHGIKIKGQLDFWKHDYAVAGLGYQLEDGADEETCTPGPRHVKTALCS